MHQDGSLSLTATPDGVQDFFLLLLRDELLTGEML
jgi:hypothetical protein